MPREKLDPRMEHGERFESEVADIYAAMGYTVKRHVPIAGQEVDILAERSIPGTSTYRVMVECKYKGGRSLAGNEDVQTIAGAYHIARIRHQVSACALVTTNGFSLPAQEAARAAGILTTTKKDLLKSLLDFSSYKQALREEYITDFGQGEHSWYISVLARHYDAIRTLREFVDEWRTQEKKPPLIIFGGYGTGKTSFCRHYAVHMIEAEDPVTPVIISLRDFTKATRIESVIRDFLEERCNVGEPRFDAFWRMYKEGLILLIFDGFDEMATRLDTTAIETNLAEIEKFGRTPSNMILTCRPEMFVSSREEAVAMYPAQDTLSRRTVMYESVEMELWNSRQVAQFVTRRLAAMEPSPPHPAQFYLQLIGNLPELYDVSTRAVHLELIVRMLPKMTAENVPFSRTNLYRTYIQWELRREAVENRRLQIISDDDRVTLIRRIAAHSFLQQRDHIDFGLASTLVKKLISPPQSELDSVTRDLLNRSFLKRQGDTYTFAHKSLGEYLLAMEVHELMRSRDLTFLQQFIPSAAIAGMVLEMSGGLPKFGEFSAALAIPGGNQFDVSMIPTIRFAIMSLFDHLDGFPSERFEGEREVTELVAEWVREVRNLLDAMVAYGEKILASTPIEPDRYIWKERLGRMWEKLPAITAELERLTINRLTGTLEVSLQKSQIDLQTLLRDSATNNETEIFLRGSRPKLTGDEVLLTVAFKALFRMMRTVSRNRAIQTTIQEVPNGVRLEFIAGTYDRAADRTGEDKVAQRLLKYHGGRLEIGVKANAFTVSVFLPDRSAAS